MSDDPKKLPPSDDQPRDPGPPKAQSQWARKEEGTVSGTDAGDEGQATFLDDSQMSLGSKLRGGGRDLAPKDERETTRLCPACNTVNQFIDGTCTNCQFKIGGGGLDDVQDIRNAAIGTGEDPAKKAMLIGALVVVGAIILLVGIPKFFGGDSSTTEEPDDGRPVIASRSATQTFAGTLEEVADDDDLRDRAVEAIEAGNSGWANEGTDAFIYRYSLSSRVISATSQKIVFQLFVGGEDAEMAADPPGNIAFKLGFDSLIDALNSRSGVSASFRIESTGGSELPSRGDVYVRYGYYYGLEHMDDIEPVVEALDQYYEVAGEYPHILKTNLTTKGIKTKQGYFFVPNGFGYLPVYKADAEGNIIMGTGGGLDSLNPDQCVGYYLVMYAATNKVGLDIHNKENEHYYQKKIAPFPRDDEEKCQNLVLTPDGEPDGITCVIKDGILLDQ